MVRLEPDAIDPGAALAAFVASAAGAGAVVSFVGIARAAGADGRAVSALFLDSYPAMTLASLEAIAADAGARFAVGDVAIVHRAGRVEAGAPIVFAAAAATHRRAAFEACDYLMDRLKTDAALWKREEGPDGAAWIEPSAADRADRARWGD